MKQKPAGALIETIQEGGLLDERARQQALAGMLDTPQVRALLSLIELAIGEARDESEGRGIDPMIRAEACGAAVYLRSLRTEVLKTCAAPKGEPET